jgi:hypothetical protein
MFLELLRRMKLEGRERAGDEIEEFLAAQGSEVTFWPGDEVVRDALREMPLGTALPRRRLRFVLEAIEDHMRGFGTGDTHVAEHRVPRGTCTIEHVMPQEWRSHWPLGDVGADERDQLVQRLGKLTLITQALNSSVSNGPWLGDQGKQVALRSFSVYRLNQVIAAAEVWNEAAIERRTTELIDTILAIWPVPGGHAGVVRVTRAPGRRPRVGDLVEAGLLTPGQTLHGRSATDSEFATVLQDGSLDVGGEVRQTPSGAAKYFGRHVNDWWYWLVDVENSVNLDDLHKEVKAALGDE